MRDPGVGLVDIARDFLEAHRLMSELFELHRSGQLRFEQLAELVGDDERSVLFRLKERCHTSFRGDPMGAGSVPSHREALFDLAVGSLFHEAMKFRENFYQREVYGPRVEALRSRVGERERALFDEFARIQQGVSTRLDEGLTECEALLAQTLEQLGRLLAARRDDPLVARFVIEQAHEVERAFGRPFDAILTEIYGDAARGYEIAARSLLRSGYYDRAITALRAASARGGISETLQPLISYAMGMEAYLAHDYAKSVGHLAEWARQRRQSPPELARIAQDAVARIGQLAEGPDRDRTTAAAKLLLTALQAQPA